MIIFRLQEITTRRKFNLLRRIYSSFVNKKRRRFDGHSSVVFELCDIHIHFLRLIVPEKAQNFLMEIKG